MLFCLLLLVLFVVWQYNTIKGYHLYGNGDILTRIIVVVDPSEHDVSSHCLVDIF